MGNSSSNSSKPRDPRPSQTSRDLTQPGPFKPFGINCACHKPLNLQPIVPLHQERPVINARTAYDLWKESYQKHRISESELDALTTRISRNAEDYRNNELKAHTIRLARLRETEKLYSRDEIPKPALSVNSYLNIADRLSAFKKYDLKYFSPKSKRPELTPEMLLFIKDASRPQPMSELLVERNGIQILRKDIQTLVGLNWLNDEIVNAYMNLLVQRGGNKKVYTFNTFFYPKLRETGYNSVRRWTRKVDIFTYTFLLVPVHLGNHWCLALIDFEERAISYYDSLGGRPNGCCDTLLDYLRYESKDKKQQEFDDDCWKLIDKTSEGIPQQKNCSDCGVFACTYAEYLTRRAKFDFKQDDMPYFRRKMIYEIIQGKILE